MNNPPIPKPLIPDQLARALGAELQNAGGAGPIARVAHNAVAGVVEMYSQLLGQLTSENGRLRAQIMQLEMEKAMLQKRIDSERDAKVPECQTPPTTP
jgi:hypothetical protein